MLRDITRNFADYSIDIHTDEHPDGAMRGQLQPRWLLTAIDGAEPDPANLVALLDGMDGAWEDAQVGWQQAQEGQTVPLDEL